MSLRDEPALNERAIAAASPLDSLCSAPADVVVLPLDHGTETSPPVRISVWPEPKRRERTVVLTDVPLEDRTRTLALALAETRLDPAVSRPAAPEPVPWARPLEIPPATRAANRTASRPVSPWATPRVCAQVNGADAPGQDGLLLTASVGLGFR